MTVEIIKVPDIGGSEGAEVIEVCVAVGDTIAKDDSLVVVESDKASMEIPSPMAGTVTAIKTAEGDSVVEGDVILELETTADESEASAATNADEPVAEATETERVDAQAPASPSPESEVPSPASAETTVESIKAPDLGGSENVDVIEVCIAVGDEIAEGDSLVVLETDKASMEVPSPKAGTVVSVAVKEGGTLSENDEIIQLEVTAQQAAPQPKEQPAQAPAKTSPPVQPASDQSGNNGDESVSTPALAAQPREGAELTDQQQRELSIYAGPAVRRLAREMGVDLFDAKGSGPKGRITKDDLKAHVKTLISSTTAAVSGSGIPAIPAIDFSKFGEVNVEPLSKIHKLTAENMHRSWLNVPHVTQFDDADITELESFRKSLKAEAERRGVKLTPLPFLLKACAAALREYPKFNASLDTSGENLVYKQYINIGMAVDTPAGLVVPVIKDVDKKSVWDLAAEIAELADKAKSRKLMAADMQGGCFTISSLGGLGGQGFTPIVNTPEVAILGVSKLTVKPVWDGEAFVPRKMLPLALSYDHRAINGVDGGQFSNYLTEVLADIRRLIL